MKLPETAQRVNHDKLPEGIVYLIYGDPKVGKSTLASEFPKPLFLATEPGLSGLDGICQVPIMTAGEAGLHMYVVLEGRVAVSVQGKVVERVGPGGVFGEMALIDHSPRAASAIAETDCSLLPLGRNDFLALIKNNPSFGVALLKTLADRLRFMTSHIASS